MYQEGKESVWTEVEESVCTKGATKSPSLCNKTWIASFHPTFDELVRHIGRCVS